DTTSALPCLQVSVNTLPVAFAKSSLQCGHCTEPAHLASPLGLIHTSHICPLRGTARVILLCTNSDCPLRTRSKHTSRCHAHWPTNTSQSPDVFIAASSTSIHQPKHPLRSPA